MKAEKTGRYKIVRFPVKLAQWAHQNGIKLQLHAPGFTESCTVVKEIVEGDTLILLIEGKHLSLVHKGQNIPSVNALIGGIQG